MSIILDTPTTPLGVIIVDHGSRMAESNALIDVVVQSFAARFAALYAIVEPAHMELAEPSIGTAFDRCVVRGARQVLVAPFFLGPGAHWQHDIPRLTAEAAARHPGIDYHIAPPLGVDELILDLLAKRLRECAATHTPDGIVRNDESAAQRAARPGAT